MKYIKFIILCCCFTACNPDVKVDTRAVKRDMENQKIRIISEGEILSAATQTGIMIVDSIQKNISRKISTAFLSGDWTSALSYCVLSDNPLVDSLEQTYNAVVSRTTLPERLRNVNNRPDDFQKAILDAYMYNQEKQLPLFNDAQLQEEEIIFSAPIILSQEQCLRCHGVKGKDFTETEYEVIHTAYPQDKSIQYQMNDFMGLWTVKFSKKEFIQSIR